MSIEAMKMALERVDRAIDEPNITMSDGKALKEILRQLHLIKDTLRAAIAEASMQRLTDVQQEMEKKPVSIKQIAAKQGINMPDEYIPSMGDAIAVGDGVLMSEQAALLRECRAALDDLLKKKPMMTGLVCGSTTLGNLRASLYEFRPQGIFGASK